MNKGRERIASNISSERQLQEDAQPSKSKIQIHSSISIEPRTFISSVGACLVACVILYVFHCVVLQIVTRWLLDHLWHFCRNQQNPAMKSFSKEKLKTVHKREFYIFFLNFCCCCFWVESFKSYGYMLYV